MLWLYAIALLQVHMKFRISFIFILGSSALEHQKYTNSHILVVKFRLSGSILTRSKLFAVGSVSIGRHVQRGVRSTYACNDTIVYNLLIKLFF